MTFILIFLFILCALLFKTKFLILSLVLLAGFLFFHNRYDSKSLILSFMMSLVWSVFSVDIYSYSFSYKFFGLFDVFPFLAFGVGLYGSWYIFYILLSYFKVKNLNLRLEFLIYTFFYISILLFGEWLFYHYVGVNNLATLTYKPLAICNCLHAPPAMAGIYMTIGPLFFMLNNQLSLYFYKK